VLCAEGLSAQVGRDVIPACLPWSAPKPARRWPCLRRPPSALPAPRAPAFRGSRLRPDCGSCAGRLPRFATFARQMPDCPTTRPGGGRFGGRRLLRGGQIWLRGLDHQMVMVPHEHPRMDPLRQGFLPHSLDESAHACLHPTSRLHPHQSREKLP
jgi:hypothetical protein